MHGALCYPMVPYLNFLTKGALPHNSRLQEQLSVSLQDAVIKSADRHIQITYRYSAGLAL